MLVVDIEHLTFYVRIKYFSRIIIVRKRIKLTTGVFGFIKS